jgi:hypothetical protein
MKVSVLKGYKSLRAFNVFHTLMLGLKMLPAYASDSYEEFYNKTEKLSDSEKEKLIREAVLFVELQPDEVEAMVSFCLDPNGVPYEKSNLSNMPPDQLVEMIVAVSMEIAKIKIDLVSDSEKKKSKNLA